MFCTQCGNALDDNAKFCPTCGSPASASAQPDPALTQAQQLVKQPKRIRKPTAQKMMQEGRWISPNIVLCADGKYRWIYEMNLFKNPTVFVLIYKIFFFIFLGIFAFIMLIDLFSGDLDGGRALETLKIFGYVIIGMTAIVGISYLLYAAIMGGKYIVEFEMDEKGVNHKQTASQAKKAKKLGRAAMIGGAATGRLGVVGVGVNARRTEMYTEFSRVRKVKAYPRRHLIKLNERMEHNQVYAAPEDYDFILNYIHRHIPDSASRKP